jgi:hypothetical protein
MGNYLAMLMGIAFIVIGGILWIAFREDFVTVLKGCIGFTFFFIGLLAFVIGWSERRASSEFEKATAVSPPSPDSSQTVSASSEQNP